MEASNVPPKPNRPPKIHKISATKPVYQINDDESLEVNTEQDDGYDPSIYRHRFSRIPVIAKIMVLFLLFLAILYACIVINVPAVWIVLLVYGMVAVVYGYYITLRWNGEEFVINDKRFERPHAMPWPFSSHTQAILRSRIGSCEIRQNPLDKLCNTCQLHSDTPSEGDELFHHVKWLTHPDELRQVSGLSAPHKNSYGFFHRRK